MKKVFLSILAVAALASCAQEDVVYNTPGNAIAFDNAFVGNTTKAIDPSITTESIKEKKFYVWGNTKGDHDGSKIVPIFKNLEVEYDGGWSYTEAYTQYWIDGNIYNFAAVVNGVVEDAELVNGLPQTIHYTAGNGDLLYAAYGPYEAEASGNPAVPFSFEHLLSKAVFTFTNTTPENTTNSPANIYKVTNIQISGLGNEAAYDVTTGWGTSTGSYTATFGDIVAADATAVVDAAEIKEGGKGKSNHECLLIPGTHNVTITCTITLYNGVADENHVVDIINYNKTLPLTLAEGTAYNLNLTAGLTQAIEFKAEAVANWNNPYEPVDAPEQGHDNN